MDCGPAALKCLLDGFGIPVSFGRLREACQTDVDGTSIDTLEDLAVQLGLDAEQVLVPPERVLVAEAASLPALVVVRLPNGFTHFVVVWNKYGELVQVMDPASGRRFMRAADLEASLYVHEQRMPADTWREHAARDVFLAPLRRTVQDVASSPADAERFVGVALADPTWRSLAALDAAARTTSSLVRSGAIRRGSEAGRLLARLFERARADIDNEEGMEAIDWGVRPDDPDDDGGEHVRARGAVLIRIRGRTSGIRDEASLPPEVAAALRERPARPMRRLLAEMREDGLLAPFFVLAGLAIAALAVGLEALLFRSFFEVADLLRPGEQRAGAMALLIAFVCALLVLEGPVAAATLRLGRRLEMRLRVAVLTKIPRLGDRYFRSRLTSDMAERAHAVHALRAMPTVGAQLLQSAFALVVTVAAIAWLDPASAPLAALVAAVSVAVPFAGLALLSERDLRVRTHVGALSTFYLDALLGQVAVRAHGAEKAVRREHESLLVEWERAGLALQRAAAGVDAAVALLGLGLAAALVLTHVARAGETGTVLLLVYWALALPAHGERVASAARQYPAIRSVALRLFEPLDAPEEAPALERARASAHPAPAARTGARVDLNGIWARAGGHLILQDVSLSLEPGRHVAIVGSSGAGKSTLVGLLLGFYRPFAGEIRVDGAPLDAETLATLRHETAWLAPEVHLWNRTLLDNLRYGAPDEIASLSRAIEEADLRGVLERLPDGLQARLGEGGGLVAGGEGQRVRLGRALLRPDARLAILDEPFRGLDREARRRLLGSARAHFGGATLVCVTHDVGDTLDFERVIVVEGGRVIEDGPPRELAAHPTSRYAVLLRAERTAFREVWDGVGWRRLRIEDGVVWEEPGEETA